MRFQCNFISVIIPTDTRVVVSEAKHSALHVTVPCPGDCVGTARWSVTAEFTATGAYGRVIHARG